jgi:Zn-dependent protease
LTALVCGILFNVFPRLLAPGPIRVVMIDMLYVNVGLGVFNLIPIPPLDGSKILAVMLPPSSMSTFFFLERYGMFIILILIFTGVLQAVMNPLMRFVLRLVLFQF